MNYWGGVQDFGADVSVHVGTIRGFRWWLAAENGWLQSPWYGETRWKPAGNQAQCVGGPMWGVTMFRMKRIAHESGSPERNCRCGFYGLHDVPVSGTASNMPWEKNPEGPKLGAYLFGIAEAWGRIFVGEHGWRAQCARAVALHVAPDRQLMNIPLDRIAKRYPALAIFPSLETMVAEFGPEEITSG